MKSLKRALRRHHRARLLKKRQYYWGMSLVEFEKSHPTKKGRLVKTPKPCSCYLCGNPRKFFKEKTVQERRQLTILGLQVNSTDE